MASNLDGNEVAMGTKVTVTCSVKSYPGSSIHWKRQQTANEYTTLNTSLVKNDTSGMFAVITNSTIMFNSSEINGASSYCCVATNVIGTTMKCLDFTKHGIYVNY